MPRRKSRRAKRGTYVSTKTGQVCKYRSNWEKLYMEYLDVDADVIDWKYEAFDIPYVSNKKTGRIRVYRPDFYVVRTKSRKQLIEVKPSRRVDKPTVVKKADAARSWCEINDISYEFVTEVDLKSLGLL